MIFHISLEPRQTTNALGLLECVWRLQRVPKNKKKTKSLLHTQERDGTIIQKNHFLFPEHVKGIFVIIPYFFLSLSFILTVFKAWRDIFAPNTSTCWLTRSIEREKSSRKVFWLIIKKYLLLFFLLLTLSRHSKIFFMLRWSFQYLCKRIMALTHDLKRRQEIYFLAEWREVKFLFWIMSYFLPPPFNLWMCVQVYEYVLFSLLLISMNVWRRLFCSGESNARNDYHFWLKFMNLN